MRYFFPLVVAACATLNGSSRTLDDGRSVRITVIHAAGDYTSCAQYVRSAAGDEIVLNDEPHHCPELSEMLAHELGHGNGRVHESSGEMKAIPFEMVIQK